MHVGGLSFHKYVGIGLTQGNNRWNTYWSEFWKQIYCIIWNCISNLSTMAATAMASGCSHLSPGNAARCCGKYSRNFWKKCKCAMCQCARQHVTVLQKDLIPIHPFHGMPTNWKQAELQGVAKKFQFLFIFFHIILWGRCQLIVENKVTKFWDKNCSFKTTCQTNPVMTPWS